MDTEHGGLEDQEVMGLRELLELAGLRADDVWVVRHQETHGGRRPYHLWRADPALLERYQALQSKPRFDGRSWLCAFVVTPEGKELFVGLYSIGEYHPAPAGTTDPLSGEEWAGCGEYTLERSAKLAAYRGRLVIKWGPNKRQWWQKLDHNNMPIWELLPPEDEDSGQGRRRR